jgi:hypothetical protein
METLIVAILGIGGFVAVIFVFGAASEKLKERTGKDIGDWFWTFVNTGILLAVGYGGYSLVRWGMNDDLVGLVVVRIVLICVAGFIIWGLWTDNDSGGYNPMSSKRAHYNKDGNLTGYSDKE